MALLCFVIFNIAVFSTPVRAWEHQDCDWLFGLRQLKADFGGRFFEWAVEVSRVGGILERDSGDVGDYPWRRGRGKRGVKWYGVV